MLSLSVYQETGEKVDLAGLADPEVKEIAGIPNSKALISFCDAFMSGDVNALAQARDNLCEAMSVSAMVDAAGIASNFQRMNRIADATGIPAESTGNEKADAMREQLNERMGINSYQSASNTRGQDA